MAHPLKDLFEQNHQARNLVLRVGRDFAHPPALPRNRQNRAGKHHQSNDRQQPILPHHHRDQQNHRQDIFAQAGQRIGHNGAQHTDIIGHAGDQTAGRVFVQKSQIGHHQAAKHGRLQGGDN